MGTRLEFHAFLLALIDDAGTTYFQPPENVQMSYPAVVYNRDFLDTKFADNSPYHNKRRYQITVIDANPDSPLPDLIEKLPLMRFVRHFTTEGLNHDIYDVYLGGVGMAVLTWDGIGEKKFENGVDHCVLYPLATDTGLYTPGVAWNGITAVNEKPSGAAANKTYADNILYASLRSAELFAATLTAYTYPDEFLACDGSAEPSPGVAIGQQGRQTFGLCYRTKIGNDVTSDLGFRLHLIYGATAAPSEKDYATVNDSPAQVEFSWDADCIPVPWTGGEPTCSITIDSTTVDPDSLSDLMDVLYGTSGTDASLPTPDAVAAFFAEDLTKITLTAATFNGAHTITIPTLTGVKYYVDGVEHAAGSVILTTGQSKVVSARAQPGFAFNTPVVTSWLFTFVS